MNLNTEGADQFFWSFIDRDRDRDPKDTHDLGKSSKKKFRKSMVFCQTGRGGEATRSLLGNCQKLDEIGS